MDRSKELDWAMFLDQMTKRCTRHEQVYEKISDFVAYLNYTEALKDCSKEFLSLFNEKYINPIVEGHEMTFAAAYSTLAEGKPLNLSWHKGYSGYKIMTEGENVGQVVLLDKTISGQAFAIKNGKKALLRRVNSCGSSSSNDRCGSSSSSSCHSSQSSSSRCGSSSSSCGSSISRC